MRKFLVPIINLVNIILVSITFGLGSNTAAIDAAQSDRPLGCYYQLVWNPADQANIIGIVGFFLFIAAVAMLLVAFVPMKGRKVVSLISGLLLIASGVFFLKTPGNAALSILEMELTGSLITMAVLLFVAGALALLMSVIDLTAKSEK